MALHPLTNFEIKKYYQNERKLNGVYSRNILPKIKDGPYVINLNKYKPKGAQWIVLHVHDDNLTLSDSFRF